MAGKPKTGKAKREGHSTAPSSKAKQREPTHESLRVTSGIPRLDDILCGGLMRNSMFTIMGPPGSGKTLLANQLCFHHVRSSERHRCVYVTLLVESHGKLLRHLSSMQFFDERLVPERISYVSGYQTLKRGRSELLSLLRKTIRQRGATMLVIDGLENVDDGEDTSSFREFIHALQGLTNLAGCTTLILTARRERGHVENALVDGVLELSDTLVGSRAVRELTVHKFRGSGYLRGRHEVEIDSSGLSIHPRTEIQFNAPTAHAREQRVRMQFGVERLDEMLAGGIPSGSSTALIGAPGTGKTMLGLSFLVEGARNGQSGLYFGFYEPPPRLLEKASSIGLELEKYVKSGLIELIWQPPLEHMMDSLAEQLLEKLRPDPTPRRRLFVDGVEGFRAAAVYPERAPRFFSALTNQLRMLDVTTLLSEELDLFKPELNLPNPELANVVESVILLRYVELRSRVHRLISIMKMRESRYDTHIREFKILDDGIVVADSFESAEAILSGQALGPRDVSARKRGAS